MKEFYEKFYAAIERSPVHSAFCERAYGIDLGQHGFADREQLELLLQATHMGPADRVLEIGCGDGRIAEYLSDSTGARMTGLDYIESAIRSAQRRTASKSERLSFLTGDINRLELPAAAYDIILSIDSMYFSRAYGGTIRAMRAALRSGGRLAVFFSHGREPWVPREAFREETLPPGRTPLAAALRENGLVFAVWDLTDADYRLALRRREALKELKERFAAEGLTFIYENRMGDAEGVRQAVEEGLHARYLYIARAAGSFGLSS